MKKIFAKLLLGFYFLLSLVLTGYNLYSSGWYYVLALLLLLGGIVAPILWAVKVLGERPTKTEPFCATERGTIECYQDPLTCPKTNCPFK